MGSSGSKSEKSSKRDPRSRSVPPSRSRKKKTQDAFCDDGLSYRTGLNGSARDVSGNIRDANGNVHNGNGTVHDINGNIPNENGEYHHDLNETLNKPEKKIKNAWSTNSLNRLRSSFRHKSLSRWSLNCVTKPRTQFPESEAQDSEAPRENLFAKLYKDNIHQKVFQNFDFNERLELRGVCRRWANDLFVNCEHFKYPCFSEKVDDYFLSHGEHGERIARLGLSVVSSNKLVYNCSKSMQSVEFTRLSYSILKNFFTYCFAENLKEIHFCPNLVEREVISNTFMNKFFEKFGKNLEMISINPNSVSRKVISDVTDTILLFTFLSNCHLTALQRWSLQISNLRTTKLFTTFFNETSFQRQIRELTLCLAYPIHEFEVGLTNCMETISTFRDLVKLTLILVPYSSQHSSELDFADIFEIINDSLVGLNMQTLPTIIVNDEHLDDLIDPNILRQSRESFPALQILFNNEHLL